jgi:hypothetical protein
MDAMPTLDAMNSSDFDAEAHNRAMAEEAAKQAGN